METPATTTLAPLGSRFGARLIDGLLLLATGAVVLFATGGGHWDDAPGWAPWLSWGIGLVYEIGLTALTGQTLGKRAAGVRVVDATTGDLPDLGQAARRAFPMVLGRVPYLGLLYPVAYLRALWHPRRQGFHDALATTIVVKS